MIVNARIESTSLGFEDHGVLTAYIHLDYGDGSHQGFGGFGMDAPIKDDGGKFLCRRGTVYGCEYIMRLLKVVGVEKWEDLRGKYVRAEKPDGNWGEIIRVGNILKDEWFNPKELAREMGVA